MLEYMKDSHRIETPKCAEVIIQQIGLLKTHMRQVPLFSKYPGNSKLFCANINPDDPCKCRETSGENQRQKSRGTSSIQEAIADMQFTYPTVQGGKNIDR